MSLYFKRLQLVPSNLCFFLKDKRIARKYRIDIVEGEVGTASVVRDYGYLSWAPHYFAVSTGTILRGLVAYWLLKNAEDTCDARFFFQFLDEKFLRAMNPFNREDP